LSLLAKAGGSVPAGSSAIFLKGAMPLNTDDLLADILTALLICGLAFYLMNIVNV